MADEMQKKTIVILGAGFGGLSAALELGILKKKSSSDLRVVVIDRNDFQLFTPDLYEIAAATQEVESEQALKNAVCIDVKLGLAQHGIEYLQASVQGVDPQKRVVTTTKGDVVYDQLLVALGSEPFYFGIPGMPEHSIPFKWVNDAITIRETIFKTMDDHDQVHIAVCGAGPAGVELAAELRMMCEHHLKNRNCFALTLVEGKSHVLPQFAENVQRAAEKRLKHLGIRIQSDFVIKEAQEKKIISTDGRELNADIIIWTGGVKASSLLSKMNIELTKRGQVDVDLTLQTKQNKNIFVIGDCAQVETAPNTFAPMTAHEAVHQGPIAARNMFAQLYASQAPLEKYVMKNEGFVIAMGGKNGIVVLPNNWILTGFFGFFARKFVDFRHFQTVLPFMQACSFWYNGVKTMMRND